MAYGDDPEFQRAANRVDSILAAVPPARRAHRARAKWIIGSAVVALSAGALAYFLIGECDICEGANTILLSSTVTPNCTVNVTPDGNATNLDLLNTPSSPVTIGTILQSCNKKVGYTLAVTSANCSGGAKLVDPVAGGENLAYSVQFTNPTTGGSQALVTGLLASACSGQTGRDVTNAKISGETTTVAVNYTGNAGLASGTYQDTITVAMTVK